jgi:4-hydroxy-tetrahydrodipicolinate reductase
MTSPLRLLIHGASGRMGQALLRLCAETEHCQVAAAVTRRSPSQRVMDGVPFFAASELSGVPPFDVAVDFSLPEGFDRILDLCIVRKVALVSGTTGLSEAQTQALAQAGERIPVLWASNFSLGVAVLNALVSRAAKALPGWDCDVIEAHHTRKKDAPSGTAITLGESAAAAGAQVSYASLRAGDIVGEHTVQFTGLGERIELTHRATNRDIFARGALAAADALRTLPSGIYAMADVLFPKD